jgi:ABC-type antimicrobial peptide transport system permease subunit
LALLGAIGLDAAAARWLPDFPFKPASFFSLPPWLTLLGLGLGLGAATLGAWLPARRAARLDPARTLAGQAS